MNAARLQHRALARLPMTPAEVLALYTVRDIAGFPGGSVLTAVRALCESHERQRMELDGHDQMNKELTAAGNQALGFVKYVLEFWDWSRFPNLREGAEELRDVLTEAITDRG